MCDKVEANDSGASECYRSVPCLLTCGTYTCNGANWIYWAYNPNPSINIVVSWGDTDIPVVVNEFSWLPGPYDNRGSVQPMEEGRMIDNYTVGVQGMSICMGSGTQCLNITSQVWLSMVNTTQDYHNIWYILHAFGFKGQEINATSSINLPFCEIRAVNKDSDWVHWQQCKSEKPGVLINISQWDVIDWSLLGSPQGKYSHAELRWKQYSLNGTVEISASANEPLQWRGVGLPSPIVQFGNLIQTNLWKMASAFYHLKAWEGKLNI